jgi:hypothetical protein
MAAPCFRGISVAQKRATFVTKGLGDFEAPAEQEGLPSQL